VLQAREVACKKNFVIPKRTDIEEELKRYKELKIDK
jgi:hypothetical protein